MMATLTETTGTARDDRGKLAASESVVDVALRVDGMHCGSCIRRVTQAINSTFRGGALPSAGQSAVKEVRLGAARFTVPADSKSEDVAQVIAALSKAGFAARVDE